VKTIFTRQDRLPPGTYQHAQVVNVQGKMKVLIWSSGLNKMLIWNSIQKIASKNAPKSLGISSSVLYAARSCSRDTVLRTQTELDLNYEDHLLTQNFLQFACFLGFPWNSVIN
jgi:hypothetical protein